MAPMLRMDRFGSRAATGRYSQQRDNFTFVALRCAIAFTFTLTITFTMSSAPLHFHLRTSVRLRCLSLRFALSVPRAAGMRGGSRDQRNRPPKSWSGFLKRSKVATPFPREDNKTSQQDPKLHSSEKLTRTNLPTR